MSKQQTRIGRHFFFSVACLIITATILSGCSPFQVQSSFQEANEYFSQGSYITSLGKYEQILEKYPEAGDRVLFEMGVIYAYPGNWQRDYQKSLKCFQKLIKDYPGSDYRQASEVMISQINLVTLKEKEIIARQKQMETLETVMKHQGSEITSLQQKIIRFDFRVINLASFMSAVIESPCNPNGSNSIEPVGILYNIKFG